MLELKSSLFEKIVKREDNILHFKTYLAGEWVEADEYLDVYTPIDNSLIAKVAKASWNTMDPVLELIYSRGRWKVRDTPGWKRLKILEKLAILLEEHRSDIVNTLIINSGKTRKQAEGEVNASIERIRAASLDVRKIFGEYMPGDWDETTTETEAVVRREPYGVVLAVVPFNYPLFDTVSKIVYSFASGNAIIIKPPSADPIPVLLLGRLLEEAGFPREGLAIATIPGRESTRLVSDRRISVISFTGSSETGKKILETAGIKQFVMELGGGDPAIVLPDADLDDAAVKIATGIYSYAGQRCDAIRLILVHEKIYDKLKDRIVGELSKIRVGDPRREDVDMGPLIDGATVKLLMEAIEDAVKKGGRVLYGGKSLGGNYVEPTLIEFPDKERIKEVKLYHEEVFAPVAIITSYRDLDEAVDLANGRRYGLDAAIFGHDIESIRKLIRLLEFGAIYVNDMPRHGIGYYPYGGRKDSGIGREGIGYSIEYVTAYKTIIYNYRGKGVWKYTL
ncbi:NADP-dependent glyceraldehyde-3-phosphate dehydrogenase [Desulfurococcus amylolyticus]|uniref:Aldehyde Dehydrogenase n=1 Tax=Desulfurococcus amylolyticus DSM 16532 TaxID=768672 RepID=I3XPV6_DESAM|nr:NADP-dependent glyceraldehyde-3-phosphate dehydrogenase [Desulfurococcus amylolyticus]AFL65980.1 Aldehyde Dehydrogenase [Desulfurococcus amylolyticus DSM 16532]